MTGTEYVDRTGEPGAVFAAHLDVWEARPAVDVAADVAEAEQVERVAEAIAAEMSGSDGPLAEYDDYYRRLARAALSAMPPADEAREREARCPATGLDADVCFGSCHCPPTADERVQAGLKLADEWSEEADEDERWLNGSRVSADEARELPAVIRQTREHVRDLRAALAAPDTGRPQ